MRRGTIAGCRRGAGGKRASQNGSQFFMLPIGLFYRVIKDILLVVCVLLFAVTGEAQIQVDLKFKRLQYIAYEPVVATLAITNLAGRDVDLSRCRRAIAVWIRGDWKRRSADSAHRHR